MIMTLQHNYSMGEHPILDALALKNWNDQKTLASYLGISLRTLERRLAVLKENSSLQIFRYKQNHVICCIGDDVHNIHDGHCAIETLKYREYLRQGIYVEDTKLEEFLASFPIFVPVEEKTLQAPKPKRISEQYELIVKPEMYIDWLCERVIFEHENRDKIIQFEAVMNSLKTLSAEFFSHLKD